MFQWRVTKYDPARRDAEGHYPLDEWTSVSDVGKTFAGVVLTLESYLAVESAHVESMLDFLEALGSPRMFARGVASGRPRSPAIPGDVLQRAPREGKAIPPRDVPRLCRACLRERIWCRLESVDRSVFVHWGYDYYMYLGAPVECPEVAERIRDRGLFVEPFASPYRK